MLFLNDYISLVNTGPEKAEGRGRPLHPPPPPLLMGIESALFQKSISLKRSICTAENQPFPMTKLLFEGFFMDTKSWYQLQKYMVCAPILNPSTGTNIMSLV